METIENMFKPEIIGIDVKRGVSALSAWVSYLDSLNDLLADITGFLDIDTISTESFLKIIQGDPETILVRLFKKRGDIPKGMNPGNVVKLGIVSNIYSGDIPENLSQYHLLRAKAESIFYYNLDIATLIDENGVFIITDDFKTALKEACTKYTKTEAENEALKNINLIIDGLNYFVEHGTINISNGIAAGINRIGKMIQPGNTKIKFDLNYNLFLREKW